MYCGSAHGRISSTRHAGFPTINVLFRITARKTPSPTWKTTLTAVHTIVLKNTLQNAASVNTATYCWSPITSQSRMW